MKSTPRMPAWIIRLTALPPPPPTPMTRIRAGGGVSSPRVMESGPGAGSSNRIILFPPLLSHAGRRGEEVLQRVLQFRDETGRSRLSAPRRRRGGSAPIEEEVHGAGPLRCGD